MDLPGGCTPGDESLPPKQAKTQSKHLDMIIKHINILNFLENTTLSDFNEAFDGFRGINYILNQQQLRLLNEKSSTNRNLLMMASKCGHVEAVEFLIRGELNVHLTDNSGNTASDYAFFFDHFDCLAKLLIADAPFPKEFGNFPSTVNVEDKERIFKIATDADDLHNLIAIGEFKFVEQFVNDRPRLKVAYNSKNQCALTTALKSKKNDIYYFLRSKYFEPGIDSEEYFKRLQELENEDKKEITRKLRPHFLKPSEDHIIKLLSKSRFRSARNGNQEKLLDFYKDLDAIHEICLILKIVASSEATDIVFDFDQEHVVDIDPTVKCSTYGLTYHYGYILIGAKRGDCDVLATIAHEFTHWAMQLIYKNICQPYFKNDDIREREFKTIIKYYNEMDKSKKKKEMMASYPVIAEVYSEYNPTSYSPELIARVPHLLALHRNETSEIDRYHKNFQDLFNFYTNRVQRDIEKYLLLLGPKKQIREANIEFGVLARSQQSNLLSPIRLSSIDISENVFIQSLVPKLVLESLVKQMQCDAEFSSKNVFVELKDILDEGKFEKLKQVAESEAKPTFIIKDTTDMQSEGIADELNKFFTDYKIVFVSSNKNAIFYNYFQSHIEVGFEWNDLNEKFKSRIRESEVIFQDLEVALGGILTDELLEQAPLELLLNPSTMKLQSFEKTLPNKPRVFIRRTYESTFNNACMTHYADENEAFSNLLKTQKTILIADSAGTGKSTSAVQMARNLKLKNKMSWMVFIDLKQHTKSFIKDDQSQPDIIESNFFSQKLLKLKSAFEQKLFESFYKKKKVIFIIDGFDEISPTYKMFVMKILRAVQMSENLLLVTTRPHYTQLLENELKTKAFKFLPFTYEDRIEFLTKYWQHMSSGSDLKSKVENLLSRLIKSNDFYSVPIHIFMLAEVYEDQDLNIDDIDLNIFSLYKQFVTRKINIWNKKGPLAEEENTAIQLSSTNLVQMFNKLALEQLLDADEVTKLNLSKIPADVIDEMIARVGIVSFGREGKPQFSHRTFAEYFVANYIFNGACLEKTSKRSIVELFVEAIKKKEFGQVRKFMNDKLEYAEEKLKTEALSKYIAKIVKHGKNYSRCFRYCSHDSDSLLLSIVLERQSHLITFVLKTLNFNYNLKLKLVKKVLHEAVDYSETFTTIWKCIETFSDVNDLKAVQKDLLFHKNEGGKCLLEVAMRGGNLKPTRLLLEKAKNSLKENDFLKFLCDEESNLFSLRSAIEEGDDTFSEIWKVAINKLGSKNQEKLLIRRNSEGKTFLHCEPKHGQALLYYLEIIKKLLNEVEFSELLTAKDKNGQLFTYYALKNLVLEDFKSILEFVKTNANEATKKELILSKNEKKQILVEAFLDSFSRDKVPKIDYIFDITELFLRSDRTDVIDFLRERVSLNDIILYTVSYSKQLFEKFSSKLEVDEFRNILLCRTFKLANVLHLLVNNMNQNERITVWNMIVDHISDPEEVKRLLFEPGVVDFQFYRENKRNVFFSASEISQNEVFIELLKWCEIHFEHEDMKNIFLVKDDGMSTVLHHVAYNFNDSLVSRTFGFASENFSRDEQQEMFLIADEKNCIPLQTAFKNGNSEVIEIFWKAYCKVFDTEKLKNIVSRKNFFIFDFRGRAKKLIIEWQQSLCLISC